MAPAEAVDTDIEAHFGHCERQSPARQPCRPISNRPFLRPIQMRTGILQVLLRSSAVVDDLAAELVFADVISFFWGIVRAHIETEKYGAAHDPTRTLRALYLQLHHCP